MIIIIIIQLPVWLPDRFGFRQHARIYPPFRPVSSDIGECSHVTHNLLPSLQSLTPRRLLLFIRHASFRTVEAYILLKLA